MEEGEEKAGEKRVGWVVSRPGTSMINASGWLVVSSLSSFYYVRSRDPCSTIWKLPLAR